MARLNFDKYVLDYALYWCVGIKSEKHDKNFSKSIISFPQVVLYEEKQNV